MGFVSPNDLQNAACKCYKFEKPITTRDWELCVNFWASNISSGLEVEACKLMATIFECPLSQDSITKIAEFHKARKK